MSAIGCPECGLDEPHDDREGREGDMYDTVLPHRWPAAYIYRDVSFDVKRLAEAWDNVMGGRRVKSPTFGHGVVEVRIGRGTTTPEDWQAIVSEYRALLR